MTSPLSGNDLEIFSVVVLTAAMPVHPFDHPEPLAATLGIMFFPGLNIEDRRKARAFTSQFLAEPLRRYHAAGYQLRYRQLGRIAEDAGVPLDDLRKRQWEGEAVGQMFKALVALYNTDQKLVS